MGFSYNEFLTQCQNDMATLVAKMFIVNVTGANGISLSNDEINILAYILTKSNYNLKFENRQLTIAQNLLAMFEGLIENNRKDGLNRKNSFETFEIIYHCIIKAYRENPYS